MSTARATAVVAGVLALAGCGGPPVGTVSGTVTLDGAPVTGGTISFVPAAGQVVTVYIQADGTYLAEYVPPGEAAVSVSPPAATVSAEAKKKGAAPRPPSPWPEKYADPGKSGLKLTVQPGPNKYDAQMKKSGG